jgi:fibronectin-binding autotransporter adhesin
MLGIEQESAPVGNPPGGTTFTAPPDQHGLILNAGDILDVNKGGKAFDTTINDGGVVNVNDGGRAESTTVNSGGVENINKGGFGGATINAGGVVNVADMADSGGSTIHAGGVENVRGNSDHPSIQGGVENVELGGHVSDVDFWAGVLKLADPKGLGGLMSLSGSSQISLLTS